MKQTGAELIWATTAPVPSKPEKTMLKRWNQEVIVSAELGQDYQQAALEVMKKHGVRINDLQAAIKPRLRQFQREDDVHFSQAGTALLVELVAGAILKCLEKPSANP